MSRGGLKFAPNILGYTENLICTWKEEWTGQQWNTDLQRDTLLLLVQIYFVHAISLHPSSSDCTGMSLKIFALFDSQINLMFQWYRSVPSILFDVTWKAQ